ncbi:Zn(II)2Cys6 transcription factor [Aspergillus chevalieri]|uniref:Zn(2)-C6 fungal-type domain-containing protein n=1 Tax=Aspergillus chevalieri TaxID=182096 RepID=A0A7R7VSD5_ASPCH|nr:uncharacterized protein ACHE_51088S [Aspergillus chevalieri]BCR89890.1 hypothetical protein ACHE_51088S [Aspergillus chevalieri]
MSTNSKANPRKLRRTQNACVACRQSKIKCSGEEPCTNCRRRVMKCRFVEAGNKVMVAERYFQELQSQARLQQQHTFAVRTPSESTCPEDVCPSAEQPQHQSIDHTRSIWTSPFSLPSRIVKDARDNNRNWIWLAPSSLWSLTARLKVMITEKLGLEPLNKSLGFLEGDVYALQWRPAAPNESPDINGLPSIDQALYLFNTVKFHLGQIYRFFDDDEAFVSHVREFYCGDAATKASECRLWFVQFLLVLAFGNAFLSRSSRNTKDPPGSKFFVRATSLMPDLASLWGDSLLAIEVLAMMGLYLYSIDHRESGHVYVGQAIRIAQLGGLHTQLPEQELGSRTLTRCRNLWWTLYIMDRHFSSSVGIPMTTHDCDITTLVDPSQQDTALNLQVKLSQMLSTILATIYKTERTQLGIFLEQTRSILHTMAGHAQEIEKIIHLKFQNSVDTMPRGTRHITLSYHQCVIVATRPLLLSILKERLEKLDHGEEDWQSFLAPTKALINTGIKSAAKTLQILSDEDSLLEVFLPFELEFTYGAAIYLTMTRTLFPRVADGETGSHNAHSILDEMICKGNKLAEVRKMELTQIESLFQQLATRIEQQGLQALTLSSPEQSVISASTGYNNNDNGRQGGEDFATATATDPQTSAHCMPGDSRLPSGLLPQDTSDVEFLESIGISSYEFLSIVDGIDDNFGILDPAQSWEG